MLGVLTEKLVQGNSFGTQLWNHKQDLIRFGHALTPDVTRGSADEKLFLSTKASAVDGNSILFSFFLADANV